MTDTSTPVLGFILRSRWGRFLCRTAGSLAVLLGGWCLWWASPPEAPLLEGEAFLEWEADERKDSTSAGVKDNLRTPVNTVRITSVEPTEDPRDSRVVPVAGSLSEEDSPEVTSASYSSGTDHPGRSTKNYEKLVGAWLTGSIEDEAVPHSGIPAWKRTSKPLRQHVLSPAPRGGWR